MDQFCFDFIDLKLVWIGFVLPGKKLSFMPLYFTSPTECEILLPQRLTCPTYQNSFNFPDLISKLNNLNNGQIYYCDKNFGGFKRPIQVVVPRCVTIDDHIVIFTIGGRSRRKLFSAAFSPDYLLKIQRFTLEYPDFSSYGIPLLGKCIFV
jgi:hypothetical protein